jgi:fibro-slime domain-containing protein
MTANRFSICSAPPGFVFAGVFILNLASFAGAEEPPETVELTGVIRDFDERTVAGGHPDFEITPNLGYGLYNGNIHATIGSDGKPVFTGAGWLTTREWKDSLGREICHLLYNSSLGDVPGIKGGASKGGITSATTFSTWYNDDPAVNMSAPLTITLRRMDNGQYVFDDTTDPLYDDLGGFFPIDGMLLGNSANSSHNYHFTFELHTQFTYYAGENQIFRFTGDDDVWVYIDGRLVIDLGGVHAVKKQYVQLDRLGLEDGQIYNLDFFFAERHRTQSNFRITTNLLLNSTAVPAVTAVFD